MVSVLQYFFYLLILFGKNQCPTNALHAVLFKPHIYIQVSICIIKFNLKMQNKWSKNKRFTWTGIGLSNLYIRYNYDGDDDDDYDNDNDDNDEDDGNHAKGSEMG